MTNIELIDISFFTTFNREACNLCGECFHKCPVILLPAELASEEMKRLIAGDDTQKVLELCQSCFSCNFYCPKNAHPARLLKAIRYILNFLKMKLIFTKTFHLLRIIFKSK
ncbi:MAG: 4Fe-4S dicluster domain-containing protein [Promethearchaeota archaeon]